MQIVYVLTIDGGVIDPAYTSLKGLCDDKKISYSSISKGKRKFIRNDQTHVISELSVCKIKGRENNAKQKPQ